MRRSRRCSSSSGSRRARPRAVPEAGRLQGLHLHLRPAATPPGLAAITGMWLNGAPIDPGDDVLGDGELVPRLRWRQLPGASHGGTGKQDTGKTDLQAHGRLHGRVRQLAEGDAPLPVDYKQRAVGVYLPGRRSGVRTRRVTTWPSTCPRSSMTNAVDLKDTEVVVKLGGDVARDVPVDNDRQAALPGFDSTTSRQGHCRRRGPRGDAGRRRTRSSSPAPTPAPRSRCRSTVTGADDCIATTVTGTNITIEEGTAGSDRRSRSRPSPPRVRSSWASAR